LADVNSVSGSKFTMFEEREIVEAFLQPIS
jgi:hypothetical protein